jgi:hypothetical protein
VGFDINTRKIAVHPDEFLSFYAFSGSSFLAELHEDATTPNAPQSIVDDWDMVKSWLGCEDRELTNADCERFGLFFLSYMAQGIAPSVELQPLFEQVSRDARSEIQGDLPAVPPELACVFDRLLASDEAIREKRTRDALGLLATMDAASVPRPKTSSSMKASKNPTSGFNWMPSWLRW